jgi:hypothetical protein
MEKVRENLRLQHASAFFAALAGAAEASFSCGAGRQAWVASKDVSAFSRISRRVGKA